MGRPASKRPTDAELEILQVLWDSKTATVRDIADVLTKRKRVAYTSIATIVRIMVDKEYVEIVDARRPQKFRPVISETEARKSVTDEWLERMFEGSLSNLVRHALTGRRLTKEERKELRSMLTKAA